MSEELKPCPFCGGEASVQGVIGSDTTIIVCGCGGLFTHERKSSRYTYEETVDAWNFRPIEDELRKQLDEANKRIAELEDIDLYVVYKKGLEDGTRKIWHSPKEVPDNGYAQCLYVCADGYCNILNSETMRAEHGKDFLSDLIKWAYVKDLKAMK